MPGAFEKTSLKQRRLFGAFAGIVDIKMFVFFRNVDRLFLGEDFAGDTFKFIRGSQRQTDRIAPSSFLEETGFASILENVSDPTTTVLANKNGRYLI